MGWFDGFVKDIFKGTEDFVGKAIDEVIDVVEDVGGSTFKTVGKAFGSAINGIDDMLHDVATKFVDTTAEVIATPIDIFLPGTPVGDMLGGATNAVLDLAVDTVEGTWKGIGNVGEEMLKSQSERMVAKTKANITAKATSALTGDRSRTSSNRSAANRSSNRSAANRSRYYYGSRINREQNKQRVIYR